MQRIKLKKREKRDKKLDLDWELNKLWNMKVRVITIVTGTLCIVTKGLAKGQEDFQIRGRVENIQTRALLKSTRILRRVLEN